MAEENHRILLDQIDYPSDLRKLEVKDLPEVCRELRRNIIEEVAVNPGHLASSLGVVEITVAVHYVFNTPDDRIVWDVGHQAYGHKILTGRREQFKLEVGRTSSVPVSFGERVRHVHLRPCFQLHLGGAGNGRGGEARWQKDGKPPCCGYHWRWCDEWRTGL